MDPTMTRALTAAGAALARHGLVDAFGHVSARHDKNPQRFLLSRNLSPNQVTAADVMEYGLDGEPVDFTNRVTWRGIMISGVPNMAYAFGYFRHSWTLRLDLVNDVIGRIFDRMAERDASVVVPELRPQDAGMELRPWVELENFGPGYVHRCRDRMFRQGDRDPWTHMHEHDHERVALPGADVDDGLRYR